MPRQPKFLVNKSEKGWRINVPKSVSATGKREQYFYPTRDKAVAAKKIFLEKYSAHGSAASIISPGLADEASKAANKLKKWGVSLTQAVDEYIAQREREKASRAACDAVEDWLKWCEGLLSKNQLRPRTVRSYRQTGEKLKSTLGKKNLAKVTAADIKKALNLKNAAGSGAALRYRNCRVFWRWCARKKWCDKTILYEIDTIKADNDGEVAILSPKEVLALMETCEKYAPRFCSHFALLVFGGIRAEEVARLEADLVEKTQIELPARVTKKKKRRYVEPCENLVAWLEKYPFEPSREWPKQFNRIRRIAGWDIKDARELPKDLESPTRGKWPQNCLRHSHASYVLQTGKKLKDLLFEFGHTGSPALLQSNYKKRAKVKAALEFFAIVPEGVEKPQTISAA
ncbi:hypothetical protein OAP01_12210 [Akkermansiaceae bacterium]|nr:hypothetical protein [Akkermansiaceae bacterium]